jgi:uncharacterized protein
MTVVITEDKIGELARRIAETVMPKRVILFGSAARGELGPDSDIDVLVVMPDGVHRGHTTEKIYRELWGFGVAKDIVVVTDSDVREHGDDPFMVIRQALAEGREVYRAP